MYLLLGNSHMESSDYEGAIQSFEHAQAQMPHHASRLLLLVSLVSFVTVVLHLIKISHPLIEIARTSIAQGQEGSAFLVETY